jgi:hypothetical protein
MSEDEPVRVIHCPACGLTIAAPPDEWLPQGGPKCAMGHDEAPMVYALVHNAGPRASPGLN